MHHLVPGEALPVASRPRRAHGAFAIGNEVVGQGERRHLELPVTCLPTGSWLSLPLTVLCGTLPGPTVAVTAAVHGDELCGIELVREVLRRVDPAHLVGTLVAVPVVNVLGLLGDSPFGPDHRDIDTSFPGSPTGSVASQLAHVVTREVIGRSDITIDLRTANDHRCSLPHIQTDLRDPTTARLARAFGAPMILHRPSRDGTLRHTTERLGRTGLTFEGGETGRFDEGVLVSGTAGVLRVMTALGMVETPPPPPPHPSVESVETQWVRARRSGVLRLAVHLGARVRRGEVLGTIGDTRATSEMAVKAHVDGVVLTTSTRPIVHQGDAVVQIGI